MGERELLRRIRVGEDWPIAGTRLVRDYQGVQHTVTVLQDGFEYEGRPYHSLSAIARAITAPPLERLELLRPEEPAGAGMRRKATTTAEAAMPAAVRKLRCSVYTRKSTQEGLDKEFDSLDAQRDACEAFIASQRAEGGVLVRDLGGIGAEARKEA